MRLTRYHLYMVLVVTACATAAHLWPLPIWFGIATVLGFWIGEASRDRKWKVRVEGAERKLEALITSTHGKVSREPFAELLDVAKRSGHPVDMTQGDVCVSTMCGGCGDNQMMAGVWGDRPVFVDHVNRRTGKSCPGVR